MNKLIYDREGLKMAKKLAKWISIITVVPFIGLFVLTTLYFYSANIYNNSFLWYLFSLVFLTVIPILAYPLKNVIPKYKDKGRSGERRLAFILAVIGYISGNIFSFVFNAPKGVKTVFVAYLFSGIILSFVNAVIGHKASGHAAGVSGPFTLLLYFISFKYWYIYLILPLVFWSRLKLGRHKITQLFSGTAVGILATVLALIVKVSLL